jgi:ParB-like nuclease family protein
MKQQPAKAKRKEAVERRRAITRAGIKRPPDTGETVDAIAAKLAANAGAGRKRTAAGAVVKLKGKDIRVAEKVFQWRKPQYNMLPSDDHILELAKATQNMGALEPILVLPVADKYYVMDGHHRLAAYSTAGWKGDIPAIVFNGSLDAAVREALRRNTKNKLPMTTKDKTEAAWRLVKEGKPGDWPDSISEVMELCGVGKGTVNRMRDAWTKLLSGQYEGIGDLSWKQAQDTLEGKDRQAFDEDSWREERAQNLADDIRRYKLALSRNPEITALALEMLDPGLPEALMAHWTPPRPFDPDEIDEDELDEDGQPPLF